MEIYCIRHTSVDVPPGICYGQSDVGLKDSYEKEKIKVAANMKGLEFEKVYSSPLSRCKKLACDLFSEVKLNFDERLMELNFGDWELKSWDAIYKQEVGKSWMNNYLEVSCPQGEPYKEMVQRVSGFYEYVCKNNEEPIVIITHAGVIRILKSIIENKPIENLFQSFKPEYGEVVKFSVKNK